jgi:tape measure domain-containing protein
MVAEVASIEVTLKLLGIDRFQAGMRGASTVSEQTGARVARSIENIASATGRAGAASAGLQRSDRALQQVGFSALRAETSVLALSKALTAAGVAVGGLAGGVAFNAFKNYADTATTIANKLAVVIPIQSQRAEIDAKIFETAQKTRTSYESTAGIFSRMSLSSKELGATQADVLRVVETTQKALKAGGATSSEAASIATQLTQALGSGRGLAGDELKSIAENSPVLLQAIATEFGVTTGALKDMGANGELAAKRVFAAIKNAGSEIDRVFSETAPTIADGIQQIDNALTRYIGNVDKSLGATKALTQGLGFIANNIGNIGDATGLVVAGLAASLVGRGATKATKAVVDPFKDARNAAAKNLADARALSDARFAERTNALGSALAARYRAQQVDAAPSTSLAGPKAIADLVAAEKRVAGQRESLRSATEKLSAAEKARNDLAGSTVSASKGVIQAEERAAAAIANRREQLTKALTGYSAAAGEIGGAQGSLPKRASERLSAAVAEREELARKLAEVDARAAAAQAQADGAVTGRGAKTAGRAARAAELSTEIQEATASRNRVGRALQEAIRIQNEKEEALQAANTAAREKAAADTDRVGKRLVQAESALVSAREDLAARAARTASGGPVRSAGTMLKAIEEEIQAQERVATLTKRRDTLSASYLDLAGRAGNASGSLKGPDVKVLNEARSARDSLFKQLATIDAQIATKTAERDRESAAITPYGRKVLDRNDAGEAQKKEATAAIAAAATEREAIAKRLAETEARIAEGEQATTARTADARLKAIEVTSQAGQRLRDVQAALVADLGTLNQRRAAVIASEVDNEAGRARKLAEIDRQIADNRKNQAGIKTAIGFGEQGVSKARQAVELDAAGQRDAAKAAQAAADAAVVASRKASNEVAESVAKAQRAATASAIVGTVARSSIGALSGLVGLLGGPFAAALTAASVGLAGYSIIQARAAAEAEKHADALGKLAERTAELNALREKGGARPENERQRDAIQQRDAARGVADIRNKALDTFNSASAVAEGRVSLGSDSGLAVAGLNDIEKAAQRVGINLEQAVLNVGRLPKASIEAADATKQLADILTEAARVDPRYAEQAIALQALAKAQREAAVTAKERADAEAGIGDSERRARSRKAVYDADEGGPLIKAPLFSQDRVKEETDAIKDYVKTVGADIGKIGENTFQFPELAILRQQLQAAVQDVATAKVAAQQLASGQIIPTGLNDAIQAFATGKSSVEEYATALQNARDTMPNFRPLIESLIESANKGLSASAALQELDAKRAALDGSSATININVVTRSIGQVRSEDLKEIDKQEADADKAMSALASKTRNLQLQAKGKNAEAKALELKEQQPGIDLKVATDEFRKQEKLQDQISDMKKKARGAGKKPKKSQEEKDGETLAKKLQELDQDSKVAGLNDFDQKTVRFAQNAKVATDQIEAFIKGAQSGDLTSIPPVMQQIYEKMQLLEGVKLAKNALDEIFPARKLARELQELAAAANASPEIAANLEMIEAKIRENNAPDWAKGLTGGIATAAKSVADGTATIGGALETLKTKIINLALDQAFKPFETAFTAMLTKLSAGDGGGFLKLLGIGGGGGESLAASDSIALAGVPMFAAGVTELGMVHGPGSGTSDSILARLSNGESVVTAKATKKFRGLIEAMNADRIPAFSRGGIAAAGAGVSMAAMMAASSASTQATAAGAAASLPPIGVTIMEAPGGDKATNVRQERRPDGGIEVVAEMVERRIGGRVARDRGAVAEGIGARGRLRGA